MQRSSDRPEDVATQDQPAPSHLRAAPAPGVPASRSGWRIFAATMILIGGVFNLVDGIIAVFDTSYYVTITQTSNGPQLVVTDSLDTWGWVFFGMGVFMICVSGAIFYETMAGRVLGVIVAGVNMVFQLAFLPVFPLWALLMILVDVLVIYGLVARYEERTLAT